MGKKNWDENVFETGDKSWMGLKLSVVSNKTGEEYIGFLCHVDLESQAIFLADVEQVPGKILNIPKGSVESIFLVDKDPPDMILDDPEYDSDEESSSLSSEISLVEVDDGGLETFEEDSSQIPVKLIDQKEITKKSFKQILETTTPLVEYLSEHKLEGKSHVTQLRNWRVPLAKKPNSNIYSVPRDYEIPTLAQLLIENQLKEIDEKTKGDDYPVALDTVRNMFLNGLKASNYREFLTLLLYWEEFTEEQELYKCNLSKVTLKKPKRYPLCIQVPGLLDEKPNILKGDTVFVVLRGEWYDFLVMDKHEDHVFFEKNQEFEAEFFPKGKWGEILCDEVIFTLNRSVLQRMHRAIFVVDSRTIRRLLPSASRDHVDSKKKFVSKEEDEVEYFNPHVQGNPEQCQAIKHITNGSSYPNPYILFGPPGTGKTVTLVEAIKQVWKMIPESRIIVGAPSNTAADLLAVRLVDDIPKEDILRWMAASREGMDVDDAIEEIVVYGMVKYAKIMKKRVIVATLSTLSRLFEKNAPQNHFTHVFIDEAGQATEPESIIPLARILKHDGHIVLAGDPHQLGPVVKSKLAEKHGLGMSLLERLMATCDLYGKDENGNRDPRVITKLLKNFRSHPKLLAIPSQLFYENELVACANVDQVSHLSQQYWIPRKNFPIIFHGVNHRHLKGENTTSLHNPRELEVVVNNVIRLTRVEGMNQNSIGVVSPYKLQVRMIRNELERLNFKDVLVGSTEEFQGQERDAIIISTVRSAGSGLGFLNNKKRFNVAITRAKSLMIVIGDPKLLSKEAKTWGTLINYVVKEGGYIGIPFTPGRTNNHRRN